MSWSGICLWPLDLLGKSKPVYHLLNPKFNRSSPLINAVDYRKTSSRANIFKEWVDSMQLQPIHRLHHAKIFNGQKLIQSPRSLFRQIKRWARSDCYLDKWYLTLSHPSRCSSTNRAWRPHSSHGKLHITGPPCLLHGDSNEGRDAKSWRYRDVKFLTHIIHLRQGSTTPLYTHWLMSLNCAHWAPSRDFCSNLFYGCTIKHDLARNDKTLAGEESD